MKPDNRHHADDLAVTIRPRSSRHAYLDADDTVTAFSNAERVDIDVPSVSQSRSRAPVAASSSALSLVSWAYSSSVEGYRDGGVAGAKMEIADKTFNAASTPRNFITITTMGHLRALCARQRISCR